jgi:predicted PurR-regulated permease PerM
MSQAEQLVDRLTAQVDHLWRLVSEGAWGTRISESLRHTLRSGTDALPGLATGVVASTLGIGGSLLVVIVAGLFLAASPHVYITGFLRLLLPPWRHRGRDVLCELGKTLRLWCLGQFIDMSVVTLLLGAGLFTLGVPLTPTLALFAGLLNFVPYVGALVGAVPAILVAMAHSSTGRSALCCGTDNRRQPNCTFRAETCRHPAAGHDNCVADDPWHFIWGTWPNPRDAFHGRVPCGCTNDLCRKCSEGRCGGAVSRL